MREMDCGYARERKGKITNNAEKNAATCMRCEITELGTQPLYEYHA